MSEPPHHKIKRALISVYDKTGIVEFARALVDEFGIEIISTGGTATLLKENGIPVTLVEEITGFPEMLDGRVKTLHPKIHAGILADRDNPEHMRQLEEQGIKPIDMVVVNLYPFEKTVADPNCTFEQAIEMIDIGGPCMLRAAAKNQEHVLVVNDPEAYTEVCRVLRNEWKPDNIHLRYGSSAFSVTTCYDSEIAKWLSQREEIRAWPYFEAIIASNWGSMRYGENPHQSAELLQHLEQEEPYDLTTADWPTEEDQQRGMSYNNYADAHAALGLCAELSRGLTLCGTGFQPVEGETQNRDLADQTETNAPTSMQSESVGVAPASRRWAPIEGDHDTRRNLPHLETTGRSYFVTFRTRGVELSPSARDLVLDACTHWHGKQMTLHAAVVMPDHVHLLLTPFETETGGSVPLGRLIHSIKSFSANAVNKLEGRRDSLWLDERFDRIMRDEKEFRETWEYIETNPDGAGLGKDYKWFWGSATGFQEGGLLETHNATLPLEHSHRLEVGATQDLPHRQDAGATRCCTFIKHTNACGVGIADDPIEAYRRAYLGDPNAAMGGILACNFDVDKAFAECVMDTYARWGKDAGAGGFFVEVWVAPSFEDKAVEHIRSAKAWGERVRLLAVGDMNQPPNPEELEYKSISGGMLVQTRDTVGLSEDQWKVVTKRKPTDSEMADMRLAWLVAKHTKSNAISVCKDGMLIGNGAGQMSRVMSCRIATWLANENGHKDKLPGSVAASDAFFPFPDGPNILIDAGVTAIIQPGGSKRDEETIAACDARDVAMIFTGTRHFKH